MEPSWRWDEGKAKAFCTCIERSHVNPVGVKGVCEIAIGRAAPAITNAIYHAIGRRIRELPVTPDKLL